MRCGYVDQLTVSKRRVETKLSLLILVELHFTTYYNMYIKTTICINSELKATNLSLTNSFIWRCDGIRYTCATQNRNFVGSNPTGGTKAPIGRVSCTCK